MTSLAHVEGHMLVNLHSHQQELVFGEAKKKVALTGRRAGKTMADAFHLVYQALLHPGRVALYVTTTREQAFRLAWQPTADVLNALGIAHNDRLDRLQMKLPNGSTIWFGGIPTIRHANVYRGDGYSTVVVDEAGHLETLEYFVEQVAEPALGDARGQFVLTGTPGLVPLGLFHDASTGKLSGWQVQYWTVRDNPYFHEPDQWLEDVRAEHGWTEDNAKYQREYEGHWQTSAERRVYPYIPLTDAVLKASRTILSFDIGSSEDKSTTGITVWNVGRAAMQVVSAEKLATPAPSDLARVLQRYIKDYSPSIIIGDPGALGAGYIRDQNSLYGIPTQTAKKSEKLSYIEQFVGDARAHIATILRGPATQALVDEMGVHQWKDAFHAEESKATPNHACDAALYGWRQGRPFLNFAPLINKTANQIAVEEIEKAMDGPEPNGLMP